MMRSKHKGKSYVELEMEESQQVVSDNSKFHNRSDCFISCGNSAIVPRI